MNRKLLEDIRATAITEKSGGQERRSALNEVREVFEDLGLGLSEDHLEVPRNLHNARDLGIPNRERARLVCSLKTTMRVSKRVR